MKKCRVDLVLQLLEELSIKTKQPLDRAGFIKIADQLDDDNINERYLYKTLYLTFRKHNQNGITEANLQPLKIDAICVFLGYINYEHYVRKKSKVHDPVLQHAVGAYMCYVRRNTIDGVVLCSPARIILHDEKFRFELKGPKRNYGGEVLHRHGCLFISFEAPGGKAFQHIYKIGRSESPDVLQGIFSGVSTTFEPIGGRVLLIRKEATFETLKNVQHTVKDMSKSKQLSERRVAEYFKEYDGNNLSIGKVVASTIDDLGTCK